jgi:hypothetical protein
MRPPKRPASETSAGTLESALAGLRTRPSFGGRVEWEALETGGFTIVLTRFRRPVLEEMRGWAAESPSYKIEVAPPADGFAKAVVLWGGERIEFYVNGAQAYVGAPAGSVRSLLHHPHDFIPAEHRPKDAALRVHLAGGSDQWVSPSKLAKFLASGRDGPLTGLDWGQLPE